MILSYGLLTMPILLVCFFGIAQIRKRSTIKSVRLTATLGLGLIGIIALFSLAYNANFDIIVGELTMDFGIQAFSFFTAFFNSVSNFFSAVAIALLITAIVLKAKSTKP